MADIFISYSQKDRSIAEGLAQFLTESGYHVWWDYELVGGVQFRAQIKRELESAKVAIVIWTPNSVESEWVVEEADDAKAVKKLLPVRVPELEYKSIPLGFRQIQTDPVNKPELILRALDDRKVAPSNKPVERRQEPLATPGGIIDATSVAASDEIAQWAYIKQSSDPKGFYDYLAKYPHSDFAELARSRISALEDKAWSAISNTGDHAKVADFIRLFPGGKFSRDAQRILYSLEDSAWSAVDKNDPNALRSHKAKFPGSFSRAWIDTRLDELEKEKQETQAWEQLALAPTKQGIENYIRRFPLGAHVDEARKMLAPLELSQRRAARWNEIKEQGFSDQLKLFIDEFKAGDEVDEAKTILAARQKRKEETSWDRVRNTRHPAEMLAFLKEFPDGTYAIHAIDALKAIPHVVDEEAWAIVSDTDRKVLYEGYLAALPNGAHGREARAKLGSHAATENDAYETLEQPKSGRPIKPSFIPDTPTRPVQSKPGTPVSPSFIPHTATKPASTSSQSSSVSQTLRSKLREVARLIFGLAAIISGITSLMWFGQYLINGGYSSSELAIFWGMHSLLAYWIHRRLKPL